MKPILDSLLDVITKPIINILEEQYNKTFDNIDKLKKKGVELEGVDKSELEEAKNKAIEELKKKTMAQLKKFGSAASLLADGTISLVSRIAGSVAGIISVTPVGPGISPNLLLPLLQQLKGEGDNLSKVFDDTKAAWDELGLEDKLKAGELGEGAEGIITGVKTTIDGIFTTAKFACMAVGSSCDGEIATMPSPEAPQAEEYKASNCENYEADDEHRGFQPGTDIPWPEDRKYCKKFEALIKKSVSDFQDTPEKTAQEQYDEWLEGTTCNDCKFFKK